MFDSVFFIHFFARTLNVVALTLTRSTSWRGPLLRELVERTHYFYAAEIARAELENGSQETWVRFVDHHGAVAGVPERAHGVPHPHAEYDRDALHGGLDGIRGDRDTEKMSSMREHGRMVREILHRAGPRRLVQKGERLSGDVQQLKIVVEDVDGERPGRRRRVDGVTGTRGGLGLTAL
jgi:hypothetical protein